MRRDGVIDRALLDRGEMPCPERRARGEAEDRAALLRGAAAEVPAVARRGEPDAVPVEAGGDPRLWLGGKPSGQGGGGLLGVERGPAGAAPRGGAPRGGAVAP